VDLSSIVNEYISRILKSRNKKAFINKIVKEINAKYPNDKEAIFSRLQLRFTMLNQISKHPPRAQYFSEPKHFSAHKRIHRFRKREFSHSHRAQANDDYLEYLAMLNDAIKED